MLESLHSVLANPAAYQLWWTLVGGPGWAKILVNDYVRPKSAARILEIGCGPGNIAHYFANYEYVGVDLNSKYIEVAKQRFPKATFVCERVSQFSLADRRSFDIVLAIGILHHLDDGEARQLFQIAHDALETGGKLVTFDGVWTNDQSTAARWLLARDRGRHIRREQEYVGIASQVFQNVRSSVRHDLLRIPYSHAILECVR